MEHTEEQIVICVNNPNSLAKSKGQIHR